METSNYFHFTALLLWVSFASQEHFLGVRRRKNRRKAPRNCGLLLTPATFDGRAHARTWTKRFFGESIFVRTRPQLQIKQKLGERRRSRPLPSSRGVFSRRLQVPHGRPRPGTKLRRPGVEKRQKRRPKKVSISWHFISSSDISFS